MAAAAAPALTIEDCDSELAALRLKLAEADDPVLQAIARFDIDHWLDRRLVLMRERLSWAE